MTMTMVMINFDNDYHANGDDKAVTDISWQTGSKNDDDDDDDDFPPQT